jgi:hypothetical protein
MANFRCLGNVLFFPVGSALSEAMLFSDVMDQKISGLGPPFEGNEWMRRLQFT